MKKSSIQVNQASLDEVDQVAILFNAYRVFYQQPPDLTRATQFIRERMERRESVILIAKDIHGTPLGFVQLYPFFSSVTTCRTWVLNDLYVDEAVRRQGVAQSLLSAAKDFALKTAAARITLATQISNATAQTLYEKNGYQMQTDFHYYALTL